jgi:hypothetical protein
VENQVNSYKIIYDRIGPGGTYRQKVRKSLVFVEGCDIVLLGVERRASASWLAPTTRAHEKKFVSP